MSEIRHRPGIIEAKQRLRGKLLKCRRALPFRKRERESREILRRIYREPAYQSAETVMAYVPMEDEIRLYPLLEDCLRKGKKLAIPLITGKGRMEAVCVPSMESLVKGAFGILTVREEDRRLLPAEEIDCVIVPGAGFTRKGERLGLGGGYYDRFLGRCPKAVRIAPAFSFQVEEKLPVEPHDAKVDIIVTEQECITIEKGFEAVEKR